MDTDDIAPPPKRETAPKFEELSVAELEVHIARLEAEIARARDAIKAKKAVRSAASTFFRS